ncbi:MAG: nuclease-related domain-containing protein [bacterium]
MVRVIQSSRSSSGSDVGLVVHVARLEILLGCGAMFAGGFIARVDGDYRWVVVGICLAVLGTIHLWRNTSTNSSVSEELTGTDRIIYKLEHQLSPQYTVFVNYPVHDNRIDALVVGPGGIFLARKVEWKGNIHGSREDQSWQVRDTETGDIREVPNPFDEYSDTVSRLRKMLANREDVDVPPEIYTLVVNMYHNVDGSSFEIPEFVRLGEFAQYILDKEREEGGLSIEECSVIEKQLRHSMESPDDSSVAGDEPG